MFTSDAHRDFLMHDHMTVQRMKRFPICDICGEPIQDESYHVLFDNNVCDRCLNDNIRFVED